jgi:hypothetical protein
MTDPHSSDPPQPVSLVATGTHVTVELIERSGESERLELDIVPDQQADFTRGFLGEGTPLGKALLGKEAGVYPYTVGGLAKVCILSIRPSETPPPDDTATRRQAVLQNAIDESDRVNAMIFASSFSGKWGDYDPSGVEKWDKEKKEED